MALVLESVGFFEPTLSASIKLHQGVLIEV